MTTVELSDGKKKKTNNEIETRIVLQRTNIRIFGYRPNGLSESQNTEIPQTKGGFKKRSISKLIIWSRNLNSIISLLIWLQRKLNTDSTKPSEDIATLQGFAWTVSIYWRPLCERFSGGCRYGFKGTAGDWICHGAFDFMCICVKRLWRDRSTCNMMYACIMWWGTGPRF